MSTAGRTIASFLIDRKARGLRPTTIKAYTHELNTFQRYLGDNLAMDDITPHSIREYILHLKVDKGRNSGDVHIAYRVIKTFLFWWELEVDSNTAPILKVRHNA
jgi:site-specific recombinase XerD